MQRGSLPLPALRSLLPFPLCCSNQLFEIREYFSPAPLPRSSGWRSAAWCPDSLSATSSSQGSGPLLPGGWSTHSQWYEKDVSVKMFFFSGTRVCTLTLLAWCSATWWTSQQRSAFLRWNFLSISLISLMTKSNLLFTSPEPLADCVRCGEDRVWIPDRSASCCSHRHELRTHGIYVYMCLPFNM